MTGEPEESRGTVSGPLPGGTVTMLFSDIEGSTSLLDRLGPAYREVLAAQRAIVREAVAAHGGLELGTEGDSFFVVFTRAGDGVLAAVSAQQALATAAWPDGVEVRVRMGLHTGEPDRDGEGYVGMDVHRAARVAASAHGGQVLVTDQTWALARPGLGDRARARDLGWHRLKDIPGPVHLLQLLVEGVPDRREPVRSLGSTAGLPDFAGDLVGRDETVGRVLGLLESGAGLVTLVGPGGAGKTRLATEVARRRAGRLAGGVHFLGLAETRAAEGAWSALAQALGTDAGDRDPQALLRRLAERPALLVLDNVEQVADIAEVVAHIGRDAPGAELLVTSRTPVRTSREHLVEIGPLAETDAMELFLERARRLRPQFGTDPEERAVLVELVDRVDRLPLALELLAGGARLLGPSGMLARMRSGARLRARERDRPERHQSVDQALDWSWQLLPPQRARAMARLGLFTDPFSLDDAVVVVGREEDEVLEELTELVDASLVRVEDSAGEPEFRILRTIARYALDRLGEEGPDAVREARLAHARRILLLVGRYAGQLRTSRHVQGLDGIAGRQHDIRSALEFALEQGHDLPTGVELVRLLGQYWYTTGAYDEGRRWGEVVGRVATATEDPVVVAALHGQGLMLAQQGRYDEAEELFRRCLAFYRDRDDQRRVSVELNSLGIVLRARGQDDQARELFQQSVAIARETGDTRRLSSALSNLAELEADHDPALSLRLLQEVLELDLASGDAWGVGVDRLNIAATHLLAGDVATGTGQLLEHGPDLLALGDLDVSVELLENLASSAVHRGAGELAAVLLASADGARERAGLARSGPVTGHVEAVRADARAQVPAPAWDSAYERGRGLSPEQAFAAALTGLRDPAPPD